MKKLVLSIILLVIGMFSLSACGNSEGEGASQYTDFQVGDTVYLGVYDPVDASEGWHTPIEWIIAEENTDNNLFTLISVKALWEDGLTDSGMMNSDVRSYLDGDFYNNAFSDDDRNAMGYWTIQDTMGEFEANVTIPHTNTINAIFPTASDRICYDLNGEATNYYTRYKDMIMYNGDIRNLAWHEGFVAGIRPTICIDKDYLKVAGSPVNPTSE